MRKVVIDKADLKRLYWDEHLSCAKVAEKLGCSSSLIKVSLKRLGIGTRKHKIVSISKEKLVDLYINKKLDSPVIGIMLNADPTTIREKLKQFGIRIRNRNEYRIGKTNVEMYGKEKAEEVKNKSSLFRKNKTMIQLLGIDKAKKREERRLKSRQGFKHTEISKNRTSNSLVKHTLAPQGKLSWFVSELGHYVRGSYEARLGLLLKRNNICYEYEKPYALLLPQGSRHYFADFTLTDKFIIVETKGWFRSDKEKQKLKLFQEQYPNIRLIVVGDPKVLRVEGTETLEIMSFEEFENFAKDLTLVK